MVADAQAFAPIGSPQAEAPPEATGVPTGRAQHATNIHVALWVLAAGGFIIAWHLSGFRIAFDVGMGR